MPERIEQPLLLELKQRLSRYHLDRRGRARRSNGRSPSVPGCSASGSFAIRSANSALSKSPSNRSDSHRAFARRFAVEAIGDARGMAQQILDRDRALQRLERQRRLAALIRLLDADLHVGKGRNVFRDGIVERELAVLDQHHRGNRRDRLRHRIEPEDRVRASSDAWSRGRARQRSRNRPACRAAGSARPRPESCRSRSRSGCKSPMRSSPSREKAARGAAVFRVRACRQPPTGEQQRKRRNRKPQRGGRQFSIAS